MRTARLPPARPPRPWRWTTPAVRSRTRRERTAGLDAGQRVAMRSEHAFAFSVRGACDPGRMLTELRVENLLLIERAELRLEAGLNVITGETGAGKTVLAHALDLLLGGKPRPGIVRPGAREAYVEGVFALPPGLLEDDELA